MCGERAPSCTFRYNFFFGLYGRTFWHSFARQRLALGIDCWRLFSAAALLKGHVGRAYTIYVFRKLEWEQA